MSKLRLLIIIFAFVFLTSLQTVSAQEVNSSPSAIPSEAIEYQLPYPGLLPDSPLYFFKVARDRIISFLISDPLKKADFNLLQADKRLSGALFLFKKDKNKENLVISTLSKGENYFEEAISKIKEAKKQGIETGEILKRLSLSVKRHREVIEQVGRKISSRNKKMIDRLLERTFNFEREVNLLMSKQ